MQSEPASLAPEVNPLLFHAFLPANVILHFPARLGMLSVTCHHGVAFQNLNWGAYFELILSTISTRLFGYFLLRVFIFLFKMFESRYSSFSDAFSLFFYFNFNWRRHLLFLHFWSLDSRRTFRRFK